MSVRTLPAAERERWAEDLVRRLDPAMSVLGLLFLFVVLGQTLARDQGLQAGLAAAGWLLWVAFVAEFGLRWYVAPDRGRFLRRHWWQLLFLVVPFLRFVRLVVLLRVARTGRVLSSAVRGTRSAGRLLSSRLGWLSAVSAVVALAASQILYVSGDYPAYGPALHDAALATVTGEPLNRARSGLAQVLEVLLAVYSVVVFATLAATLGAYFLGSRASGDGQSERGNADPGRPSPGTRTHP